jgi:ABC-type phosphonate transport system ATPase subunit
MFLLFVVEPDGVLDVDIRASLGDFKETCLVDTPLLVILSTHVTLCTVLMGFLL